MTVDDFLKEWHSEEPFVVAHTSGSTGKPKEIKLLKADMRASAALTNRFFSIGSGSTLLLCLSPDYIAGKMMIVRFDPQNVPDTFRCGPMKLGRCYAMDVMQMDAFAEIKNYAGRVCIVHGTKDKIVDVSYANRAAEAYKSTMPIGMQEFKRVQLHFIDGGGHMFSKKHDVIAMKLLKEFAAKHE